MFPVPCLSTTVRASLAGRTNSSSSPLPPEIVSRSSLAASASVSTVCTSCVRVMTPPAIVSSVAVAPARLVRVLRPVAVSVVKVPDPPAPSIATHAELARTYRVVSAAPSVRMYTDPSASLALGAPAPQVTLGAAAGSLLIVASIARARTAMVPR